MSITLYFAKLNLVSDDLFELYDSPKKKNAIKSALYKAINANCIWEKENVFIDETGEPHSTFIEYSTHILRTDSTYTYIEGWLYKKSKLYYKVLDSVTGQLVQKHIDNTEGIRFTVDVSHGFVGYNRSARFGYKDFIEAFVTLVNMGEEANDYNYRYSISTCTSGINLNDIKQELKNIGRIRELRIRMQPPNPSDELLDELQKRCDGVVKGFKDANVTELELFYSNKGVGGINISSPFVDDRINDIQGLYSSLPVESTKKGYVSIEATSVAGRKYSSGDEKPFRKIVDGLEDIFESCIDAFHQLK